MIITDPKVLMPGLTAKRTRTGFVAAKLHYSADPIGITDEFIASEKARLPGWRFRKEYEMDATAQAGEPVFEPEWLDAQRPRVRDPACRMDLGESGELVQRDHGRLWVFLEPDAQPSDLPRGIAGVDRGCGIGMDVGEGVEASDSTIQVLFADNREHAAEFACNKIRPAQLGRFAVVVGKWYNNALICCVRKMHGLTVLRTMADELHYPFLWHAKAADRIVERQSHKLGWSRGEMSDEWLVGPMIDALQFDRIRVHGQRTLGQLGQYIYDETGKVCHQLSADLPTDERRRHGDLVVALCLAGRACQDMPLWRSVRKVRKRPVLEMIEKRQAEERSRVWRREVRV